MSSSRKNSKENSWMQKRWHFENEISDGNQQNRSRKRTSKAAHSLPNRIEIQVIRAGVKWLTLMDQVMRVDCIDLVGEKKNIFQSRFQLDHYLDPLYMCSKAALSLGNRYITNISLPTLINCLNHVFPSPPTPTHLKTGFSRRGITHWAEKGLSVAKVARGPKSKYAAAFQKILHTSSSWCGDLKRVNSFRKRKKIIPPISIHFPFVY